MHGSGEYPNDDTEIRKLLAETQGVPGYDIGFITLPPEWKRRN
jgi:hypothetical protein